MPTIERKTCTTPDGVTMVYSAAGAGEPALVFIHGGLANRDFWTHQLHAFAARHRVLAPDLAGHGESGNRSDWSLPQCGADVRAVLDAERIETAILFGNSLGGPVAIEAALLVPEKILGVVGVDTFHSLAFQMTPAEARQRAEAFRADYAGSLKQMVKALFHPDATPALLADAEQRMSRTSPEVAYSMYLSFGNYDLVGLARRLAAPLRAINGDLWQTDVKEVRQTRPEFQVAVMPRMGHYPMLERPKEFDRLVANVVAELTERARSAARR